MKLVGLHKFMNWHRPILTDSGGFLCFRLKVPQDTEEGAKLKSYIDGLSHMMTRELAEVQAASVQISRWQVLHPAEKKYVARSLERTQDGLGAATNTTGGQRLNPLWKQALIL